MILEGVETGFRRVDRDVLSEERVLSAKNFKNIRLCQ